jgi:hypothetical protein
LTSNGRLEKRTLIGAGGRWPIAAIEFFWKETIILPRPL